MLNKYGFVRVGAVTPNMKVADTTYNTDEIIKSIKESNKENIQILVFPELCITGYTCADLFAQTILLDNAKKSLERIVYETKDLNIISIVGMPLKLDNNLFNVAVVIQSGNILGIVPKTCIPNYEEFYEKRWFDSSLKMISKEINLFGNNIPIGTDLIFRDINNEYITFGIEICEDMWVPTPPSVNLALNGANLIFNLSASNEVVGKYEYRKNLINSISSSSILGYIYCSAGINESSTDLVFGGDIQISENGTTLEESKRFNFNTELVYSDIDVEKLAMIRIKRRTYMEMSKELNHRNIYFNLNDIEVEPKRTFSRTPFVPSNENVREERCKEIFNIQSSALAKRLLHTGVKNCVIGISGGLDSTLAFLVTVKAFEKIGLDKSGIIGITMPGFGTTKRTYNNSIKLINEYGATLKEIDIKDACKQHFLDIGHDSNVHDITYENTQARERTQILMDVANKVNGLVIGTGDLSELALGWCTYNGDHMSMYAVNVSIPKTLVKYLVKWVADTDSKDKKDVIYDILDTKISPELLPPDENDNIKQVTEDNVGPYELHDFFIYYFLRFGFSPSKIFYLASNSFKDIYDLEIIKKWLKVFIKRFFSQQFKRSCLPDGPKVGSISVSPRGDLRMPSDAMASDWLNDIKE